MVVLVCLQCSTALRVVGEPSEVNHLVGPGSDLWPDKFVCPTCRNFLVGMHDNEMDEGARASLKTREITALEAFAAVNGLGLPEEQPCSGGIVDELLRETPIRKVVGKDIPGSTRFCIDHLELWDGTKVYFGAGREGALIYRISRPHSYVETASE